MSREKELMQFVCIRCRTKIQMPHHIYLKLSKNERDILIFLNNFIKCCEKPFYVYLPFARNVSNKGLTITSSDKNTIQNEVLPLYL